MRNVDSAFMAALVGARERGIVPRKLVSITGADLISGAAERRNFWSGDGDMVINVVSGLNGLASDRRFVGDIGLSVSSIPRVSDLSMQTISITMSQIADAAQELVRGLNIRLAKVEVWEALIDPDTRLLVSSPPLVFLGQVDGSPIDTPEVGGEGRVEIRVVSDAISMLMRNNPAKSSYETQARRHPDYPAQKDAWGKYSASVKTWRIPWGIKK